MPAQSKNPGVTSAAAERKARQRARDRALLYERDDWQLFLDLATLPQKAGCHPHHLRKVVLKELVDNELDLAGQAELRWCVDEKCWVVSGTNPGPLLSEIPTLFCVNRPLVSSKLKRMPTRGMLGNGLRVVMGVVHALGGWIIVEAHNQALRLQVDSTNGSTIVVRKDPLPLSEHGNGMRVLINLGEGTGPDDAMFARDAIYAADKGTALYSGPSSLWWYGVRDLSMLFAAAPAGASVGEVAADLGLEFHDERVAKTIARDSVEEVLAVLRDDYKPVAPEKLGRLGENAYGYDGYGCELDFVRTPAGALVPYVVEAWANAQKAEKKGTAEANVILFVNRSRSIAPLYGSASVGGIKLWGCGISRALELKSATYQSLLSVVTPYIQLAGDGKEPVLTPLGGAIEQALKKACNVAYRLMDKPEVAKSIKEAAYQVMEQAYLAASGQGQLPASARQIMYQARPLILAKTGKESLNDEYFTQKLLPDYMDEHPGQTARWRVTYDARGHFVEPHTLHQIGLGTLEVEEYLESKAQLTPAVSLSASQMYPTRGPKNRYQTILFVEKEGFTPLLEAAQIAERFDIGIMSTKGMSVTAARRLLDSLSASPHLKKVLILHDFDVYGFSIFGTLGADTRRYTFANAVPIIDLGLRVDDVQALGLDSEPYEVKDWEKRISTLRRHGASEEEIAFLENQRVELNALSAPTFVEWLEGKLTQHATKVIPPDDVIEGHARRIWQQLQATERCKTILEQIEAQAATAQLPADLKNQVEAILQEHPALSWDQALAKAMADGRARQ